MAEVHRRGATLAQLSEDAGLSRRACSTSLHVPFPAADRAIAKFIKVPLHVLWPDRYDSRGRRLTLRKKRAPVSQMGGRP
ncbi:MAG: helix-turn-helix domain-containing protein [Hyphomicrobiaceae bacterium]|nr:helix-turn-helix domain-containing protein [Hyphomicrobiaceae bacterium]